MLTRMTRPGAVLVVLLCACPGGQPSTLEGPTRAKFERRTGLPGVDRPRCSLALPKGEYEVPCPESLELEENVSGTLVAFRSSTRAWSVARVEAEVVVIDCRPGLGDGRHPDFDSVTKVPAGAFACEGVSTMNAPGQVLTDVLRQLSARKDDAGAAELLAALASTLPDPWAVNDDSEDPWAIGAFTAADEVMALVKPKLCPTLLDPSAPSARWLRAARVCAGTPEVADAAIARLAQAFRAWPPPVDHQPSGSALRWAVTFAARFTPAEAGAVGCEALQHDVRSGEAVTLARAAVAAAHLDCPAAGHAVGCEALMACDGRRCAPSDLERELSEWLDLKRWVRAPRAAPVLPGDAELSLITAKGAAFAARCDYEVVEVAKPPCGEAKKAGTPCSCGLAAAPRVELPLDGGWQQLPGTACEVRADDHARKVGFTRRAR
jgi:hypothetical protein